uniref:Uncharacterized protein n=1 Tax=Glossina pallidipes TaxID=7398 RepID=A0A1A9Z6H0_GLOPL
MGYCLVDSSKGCNGFRPKKKELIFSSSLQRRYRLTAKNMLRYNFSSLVRYVTNLIPGRQSTSLDKRCANKTKETKHDYNDYYSTHRTIGVGPWNRLNTLKSDTTTIDFDESHTTVKYKT